MLEQIHFPFSSLSLPKEPTVHVVSQVGFKEVNQSYWIWWICLILAVLVGVIYWCFNVENLDDDVESLDSDLNQLHQLNQT